VPQAGVELRYILAKGAAKGKPFSDLQDRIEELLECDHQSCLVALQDAYEAPRMWCAEEFNIPTMESWYETEPGFVAVRKGRKFRWAELKLYMRRIVQPTGVCVCVVGELRFNILEELGELLRPGFRRLHCVSHIGVMKWFEMAIRLIKTTLVVAGKKQSGSGSRWLGNRLYVDYRKGDDFTKEILENLSLRLDSRF
jgi:hypothetical protein